MLTVTNEILLGYDDREGCNLRGFYDPSINRTIPCKTISVTDAERLRVMKNKLLWRVEDGKLITLKDGNFKKSRSGGREDLHTVTFNSRTYSITEKLMSRLALNLSICSLKPEHSCDIWCVEDSAWQKVTHSKNELLDLSIKLNSDIEDHSTKIYGVYK